MTNRVFLVTDICFEILPEQQLSQNIIDVIHSLLFQGFQNKKNKYDLSQATADLSI